MEDDESFAVGMRFNLMNDRNVVEIKHIASQTEIKVSNHSR